MELGFNLRFKVLSEYIQLMMASTCISSIMLGGRVDGTQARQMTHPRIHGAKHRSKVCAMRITFSILSSDLGVFVCVAGFV